MRIVFVPFFVYKIILWHLVRLNVFDKKLPTEAEWVVTTLSNGRGVMSCDNLHNQFQSSLIVYFLNHPVFVVSWPRCLQALHLKYGSFAGSSFGVKEERNVTEITYMSTNQLTEEISLDDFGIWFSLLGCKIKATFCVWFFSPSWHWICWRFGNIAFSVGNCSSYTIRKFRCLDFFEEILD